MEQRRKVALGVGGSVLGVVAPLLPIVTSLKWVLAIAALPLVVYGGWPLIFRPDRSATKKRLHNSESLVPTGGFVSSGGATVHMHDSVSVGYARGFVAHGPGSALIGKGNIADANVDSWQKRVAAIMVEYGPPKLTDAELARTRSRVVARLRTMSQELEKFPDDLDATDDFIRRREEEYRKIHNDLLLVEAEGLARNGMTRLQAQKSDQPCAAVMAYGTLRSGKPVGAFVFDSLTWYLETLLP